MATYGELRDKIVRLTGDDTTNLTALQEQQLLDAIVAAHDAILPWVPKTASTVLTGTGLLTEFALPASFYDVDAVVVDSTGEILPQAVFSPGLTYGESITNTNDWLLRPSGYIKFSKAIESGVTYTMFYLSRWATPTSTTQEGDVLEPPEHLITAMIYFAAAYVMITPAIDAAEIRQWNTRVDSGNPEHNPLQKSVTFLLSLFNQEMSRVPTHIKAER